MSRTFRSSGRQFVVNPPQSYQAPIVPVGIKTPMTLKSSSTSTPFDMHTNFEDQISDNLKNLILTNHGERLGLYDFGANLSELLMESIPTEDMTAAVEERINIAVQKYMPGIQLDAIEYVSSPSPGKSLASFNFVITYSYPQIGINRRKFQVNLAVAG